MPRSIRRPFAVPVRPLAPRPSPRVGRRGVTLIEVMMSLLVMGIGVSSVIYLFPLSVARSIQATQLTNATILRQNAESRIRFAVSLNATTNRPIRIAVANDPDKNGSEEDEKVSNYLIDPLGAAVLSGDGAAGPIGMAPGTLATDLTFHSTLFGDVDGDGTADGDYKIGGTPAAERLRRYTFGLNTVAAAENFVTLPDSTLKVADVVGPTVTGTDVTLPGYDLSEYAATVGMTVTAFHSDGRQSATRQVESVAGGVLTLDSDTAAAVPGRSDIPTDNSLPTGFAGNVGRVLVEVPERRYTWMATVRRPADVAYVSVVVFFRRVLSVEDERMVSVTEVADQTAANLPRDVNLYNTFINPGSPPPGFTVGGYMFDLQNFRWLRITAISETTGRFTAESDALDPNPGLLTFKAIFPRNVVAVYPLDLSK